MELMATAQTPSVDATSSEVPSIGSSPFQYDIVILGVYTMEVCTPKSLRLVKFGYLLGLNPYQIPMKSLSNPYQNLLIPYQIPIKPY
jgi:hypothetical protein